MSFCNKEIKVKYPMFLFCSFMKYLEHRVFLITSDDVLVPSRCAYHFGTEEVLLYGMVLENVTI